VVSLGAKAFFGMAVAAVVAVVAIIMVAPFLSLAFTYDKVAITTLWFVAAGAFVLGVMVVVADPDRPPWYAPDSPISQQAPVGARPSRPSPWPLAMALVFGVGALAAASIGVVVVAALGALLVVGVGWLLQTWSDHPTYTPSYAARLKDRFVIPVGLPIAVLALIAIITASLSRVFLALPEAGTRWVAIGVATVVVLSGAAIAASERMARTALLLLSGFALACLIGAGAAGVVHGESKFDVPNRPAFRGQYPPGLNPGVLSQKAGSTGSSPTSTSTSTP
jgi:hypothetical protein